MDSSFCFNKDHFTRSDFDVDRFVSLARRRATLDQIQNDLRLYLRQLQNSMVELINNDYADFVNLSSSLASLNESIHKISANFTNTWSNFLSSIKEIKAAAEFLDTKSTELSTNKTDQILIRNKISLLLSIERLANGLSNKSTIMSRLSNLVNLVVDVELWYSQIPENKIPEKAKLARETYYDFIKLTMVEELVLDLKNKCSHVSSILVLISLIGETSYAVEKVCKLVVNEKVEDFLQSEQNDLKEDLLQQFLNHLLSVNYLIFF